MVVISSLVKKSASFRNLIRTEYIPTYASIDLLELDKEENRFHLQFHKNSKFHERNFGLMSV